MICYNGALCTASSVQCTAQAVAFCCLYALSFCASLCTIIPQGKAPGCACLQLESHNLCCLVFQGQMAALAKLLPEAAPKLPQTVKRSPFLILKSPRAIARSIQELADSLGLSTWATARLVAGQPSILSSNCDQLQNRCVWCYVCTRGDRDATSCGVVVELCRSVAG